MSESTAVRVSVSDQSRALRILAKSVYRELIASGYGRAEVVQFTNEILDLVTTEMRHDSDEESAS